MEEGPEEYLEALYKLTRDGKPVRTTQLAKYLNVTPASATQMLKKLAAKGCVEYTPYRGVTLTPEGEKRGAKVTRKHRLLETFLIRLLNLGKEKAHQEACELEHHLSDEAEEALCRILKHPDFCADDNMPIPPCDSPYSNCEECMAAPGPKTGTRNKILRPLSSLPEGMSAKVAFIRAGRGALQRLYDMGLTPGTEVQMIRTAPLKGPVEVSVRGSKLAVGWGLASKIFVEADSHE